LEPDVQIDEINLRAELARCLCTTQAEAGRKLKLHVQPELDPGEAQNLSQ